MKLAMATLGTTFLGAAFAMSGGDKKKSTTPPIDANSKDEEAFIKSVSRSFRLADQSPDLQTGSSFGVPKQRKPRMAINELK